MVANISIYKITNRRNGWVYIGSSKDYYWRFRSHWNGRNRYDSPLSLAMRLTEKDDWTVETLVMVDKKHRWNVEKEMTLYYREKAPGCYNVNIGVSHAAESRAKISTALRNPESRAKISAAAKSRCGAKNNMYGKHHSAATRAKMSAAKKGDKCTHAKKVLDIETGITYTTRNAAAEAIGKSTTYIAKHPERFVYERRQYKK